MIGWLLFFSLNYAIFLRYLIREGSGGRGALVVSMLDYENIPHHYQVYRFYT